MTSPELAGAELTIDLGAVVENYLALARRTAPALCAAVVKADAYGLGMAEVAPALHRAGCPAFCVAHIGEGIALRGLLGQAEIFVLHGLLPDSAGDVAAHSLIPVLNDLGQIAEWRAQALKAGPLPAAVQLDSGMSRLGLPAGEVEILSAEPERLDGLDLRYWASHLVSAEEADNPLNAEQLRRFNELRTGLSPAGASLANSSGIFLGSDYHFEMVRPGVALYGVNPTPGAPNPMREAVQLRGRIIQLQQIDRHGSVGYGAAWRAERASRIATVAVGYADGYLRGLGKGAFCIIGGARAPIVGRVSMDLITIDVTEFDAGKLAVGTPVNLIGDGVDIDELAAAGGTIAYELLTLLGARYQRRYLDPAAH